MFEPLLEAATRVGNAASASDISDGLTKHIPVDYTLQDLLHEIVGRDESGEVRSLKALQVCLKSDNLSKGNADEGEAVTKIAEYVTKSIEPIVPDSGNTTSAWKSVATKGEIGLNILEALCDDHYKANLDPKLLVIISAYTDSQDLWTTQTSATSAQSILDKELSSRTSKIEFITSTVLLTFLRPLFSKSRPAAVTASGRKAEFVETTRYTGGSSLNDPSELELKPWKHAHRYAISVFHWAVTSSDQDLLAKHWHLFTPVMFTLLDEPQTEIKVRAMQIFSAFWERCPPNLMDKVGLAQAFEHAIFPAVLYLPSLTPQDESIRILSAAYPALFQIAGLPFPETNIGEPVQQKTFTESQNKMLDKILRQGIFVGYHHASDHIQLVELLCQKATFLVQGMGILAVKHLKYFLPMISEIMTEPFATKYSPALFAANQLLVAIMRCCWPRVGGYSNDIIRVLTICYLNVEDEDEATFASGSPNQGEIKGALAYTAQVLSAILAAADRTLDEIVSPLVAREPLLKELFTFMSTEVR